MKIYGIKINKLKFSLEVHMHNNRDNEEENIIKEIIQLCRNISRTE